MKKRLFAAISALTLCMLSMPASASSTIVLDPEAAEGAVGLSDYTTDYDSLNKADYIMFDGNQVLLKLDLMVQVEGCEISPDEMKWEVSGTANVSYESDSFFKSISYEENYANSYCLITADSPGTVCVKGQEFNSSTGLAGAELYWNLTVCDNGNFDRTVTHDEPVEMYRVNEDSVHFLNPNTSNTQLDLIVSSNLKSTVEHDSEGCVFTPQDDGRYVVTAREYSEKIIPVEETHFHYFYPVLKNYVVDVTDSVINVELKGSKSWYSEEQINEEIAETKRAELIACYDVTAADSDDVLDETYFSYASGQIPDMGNSYITTVYGEYATESYFCTSLPWRSASELDVYIPRVMLSDENIGKICPVMTICGWVSGDLDVGTCDVIEFYRVQALSDGDITVTVDEKSYNLTVKNGVFHHAAVSDLTGDVNNDSKFSVADVVMLQKWLLCAGELTCWQNGDFCADKRIDVFDLCVMKRELLEIS